MRICPRAETCKPEWCGHRKPHRENVGCTKPCNDACCIEHNEEEKQTPRTNKKEALRILHVITTLVEEAVEISTFTFDTRFETETIDIDDRTPTGWKSLRLEVRWKTTP